MPKQPRSREDQWFPRPLVGWTKEECVTAAWVAAALVLVVGTLIALQFA